MKGVLSLSVTCLAAAWAGPGLSQTKAQLEAQYADECSAPTDDPDVRDSCEGLASLIGRKGVTFTGDYPPIPAPKGMNPSAAFYYAQYTQHCAVARPTGTAAQCNEWKKKVDDATAMVKFGLKAKPPQPTAKPSPARCDGCPTGRAK